MALLHYLHRVCFHAADPEAKLFATYKWQSFKMKLSYESWLRKTNIAGLLKDAIYHTLVQKQQAAA